MSAAPTGVRRARVVCAGVALALVIALLVAEKPWRLATGPGFLAPPERLLGHTVAIALWWAAGVNAILCLLLAATAQLWAGALPDAPAPPRVRTGVGFALLLAAAAALGLGLRWPLANTGLWSDEAWSLRFAVSGIAKPDRDDPRQLVHRAVSWRNTLWRFEEPTNQVASSVASRISLGGWRRLTGAHAPVFDELALRLPALVAAVLSIPLAGLLLRELGLARAGVAAAFLLAIHPWHVRWGATARGYALVIAFALLGGLALARALRSGRARDRALFAAALFGLVWSHVLALWLALSLAAAGLVAAARGAPPRRARTARLSVACLLAAMLLGQVMAPNLAQLRLWGGSFVGGHERARLTLPALGHLWTFLAVGLPAREPDVPERRPGAYPDLAGEGARHPGVYAVAFGVIPLLALAGLARLWRRGATARAVALGLAAGLPLALLFNLAIEGIWYARFGLYALPALVLCVAAGLEGGLARLPWKSPAGARAGTAAGIALGLLGFQAVVWPQTALLLSRPHQPSRELAAALAHAADGDPLGAIRAVFSNVDGGILMAAYLPWVRDPVDAGEVAALCAEARETGKPLFLAWGHPARNRRNHPELFRWLDDPALFEPLATWDAVEVEHLMRAVRYTGRPLPEPPR